MLARIMHETPSRDRGDGRAIRSRLEAAPTKTRLAPEEGGVYEAKRIRSHYLPLLIGRLPGFCTLLRHNAKPHSILSMTRLCAFVEQITLPGATHPPWTGSAASPPPLGYRAGRTTR